MTSKQTIDEAQGIVDALTTAERPGNWDYWSLAERAAWIEWDAAYKRLTAAEDTLRGMISEDAWHVLQDIGGEYDAIRYAGEHLLTARLQRHLPQHADLIAWAFDIEAHGAP